MSEDLKPSPAALERMARAWRIEHYDGGPPTHGDPVEPFRQALAALAQHDPATPGVEGAGRNIAEAAKFVAVMTDEQVKLYATRDPDIFRDIARAMKPAGWPLDFKHTPECSIQDSEFGSCSCGAAALAAAPDQPEATPCTPSQP